MEDLSGGDIDDTKVAAPPKQIDYAGCLLVDLAYWKNEVSRALEAAFRWGTSQGTPPRGVAN